jgi:hypothetical protein
VSSISPFGRLMNFGRSASGGNIRFSMRNCSNMVFVVDTPAAASTLTINEANAASGGTSQALAAGLTEYYTQLNGVWTRVTTGIAGAVITVSGSPDLLVVVVNQGALSDTFAYLSPNHSAKATEVVMSELGYARKPANLADVRA